MTINIHDFFLHHMYHILADALNDVQYDVFISFAEEDKEAAENIIKHPLSKMGYSVCWHHDDFIPGCTIEDNMERAIFKSRLTIILISNAFISSKFCQKEFSILKRKMQQTSTNCLVPVMMNANFDIPPEFQEFTYINIDDKNFIQKLSTTLGMKIITIYISTSGWHIIASMYMIIYIYIS